MDLSAHKILVVDDVRFTRLTLTKVLHDLGAAAVLEAGDGEAALALLQQQEGSGVDCIITDLDMPKLDGLGLLKAIRTGAGNFPRDTKVVLLTGHSDLDRIGSAMLLDLDAFLAKPVSRQAVEECLGRLFAAQPAAASPSEGAVEAAEAAAGGPVGERLVAVVDLPPDAELARDLLFGNGRLLLAAGSRLTLRTKRLLGEVLMMAGLPAEVWIRASR